MDIWKAASSECHRAEGAMRLKQSELHVFLIWINDHGTDAVPFVLDELVQCKNNTTLPPWGRTGRHPRPSGQRNEA